MRSQPSWNVAKLVVLFPLIFCLQGLPEGPMARSELAAKLGPFRLGQGRLAGLRYAPPSTSVSPERLRAIIKDLIRSSASRQRELKETERGLLALAAGDFDKAAIFYKQSMLDGQCSEVAYNDLAALSLHRYEKSGDRIDLITAMDNVDKALHCQPSMREAKFNKALILAHLCLRLQGRRAWEEFLEHDRVSRWARIAKVRLAQLYRKPTREEWPRQRSHLWVSAAAGDYAAVRKIVQQFPQSVKDDLEEEFFLQWPEKLKAGNSRDVESFVRSSLIIANVLAEKTGDRLLLEVMRSLSSGCNTEGCEILSACSAFAEGKRLYKERRTKESRVLLEGAVETFDRVGSPIALWARFYVAASNYYEKNYADAFKVIDAILVSSNGKSYPTLRGNALWLLGVLHFDRGQAIAALKECRKALNLFAATNELGNLSSVLSLEASILDFLGNRRLAWDRRIHALALGDAAGDGRRLPVTIIEIVYALLKERRPRLARCFQGEIIRLESESGDALAQAEAFWFNSLILIQLGELRQAAQDLSKALTYASQVPSGGARRQAVAGIMMARGMVAAGEGRSKSAIADYSRALDIYNSTNYVFFMVALYQRRALELIADGRPVLAQHDLQAAVELYEKNWKSIADPEQQIAYFGQAKDIFEQLIELSAKRDSRREALQLTERSRARTLALEMSREASTSAPPLASFSTRELQNVLSPGVTLVEYEVLDSYALVWLVTRTKVDLFRLPASRAELSRITQSVRRAIAGSSSSEIWSSLQSAYDELVRPIEAALEGRALVFVPDREIAGLPFAALYNDESKEYLIEKFEVMVSPSAYAHYSSEVHANNRKCSGGPAALLVGGSDIGRSSFKELPRLPYSEVEIERTASFYPKHKILVGREATLERFLANLDRFDVIQFSGHSLSSGGLMHDALLLTPEEHSSGDGRLSAYQISLQDLSKPALVILSSCRSGSGAGAYYGLEGDLGLSRSFLAAGVPSVLGTLWQINDRDASPLLESVHARLSAGVPSASALRSAQVELLRRTRGNPEAVRIWGAFQVAGTSTRVGCERKVG